jgi:PAS domain S-box-containing protein
MNPRRVPVAAACLAAVVGALVAAGWAFDVAALRTLIPGSVPVKANTAVAFVLAALALGFGRRPGGRIAAAGLLLIAGATLWQYLTGWNLRIDELLFQDPGSPFRGPGRMAVTTAVSLLALGTALVLSWSGPVRLRRSAEVLGGISALLALLEIERFVLGATQSTGHSAMAVPTALVLMALAVGVIVSVPDGWLRARVQDPGLGGMLARRLLPANVLLSLALGEVAQRLGWQDPQNVAMVVTLGAFGLSAATLWCVAIVERLERSRRTAETGLRDIEDQFRRFFEEAPIGKVMTAPDGRFLRVNRALSTLLGYSLEELQQVSWMDITHPDDIPASREAARAVLAGEVGHWEMEKRYRAKDGRWVWTQVSFSIHRGPEGTPQYFLTHIQDISARKEAVEELQNSEQWLAEAQGLAHVGSWRWEVAPNQVKWSKELYRIYGLTPDHPAGYEEFLAVLHPEDRPRIRELIERQFRDHEPLEYESRVQWASGEVRHLFNRQVVIADAAGHPLRMMGTALDITERKAQEETLRTTMSEVRTLRGLLRICASCKRVHTENDGWENLDSYVRGHSQAEFTHGMCPDCAVAWAAT